MNTRKVQLELELRGPMQELTATLTDAMALDGLESAAVILILRDWLDYTQAPSAEKNAVGS